MVLVALASLFPCEAVFAADDWKPPEAALSRKAFEAQYPPQTVSAAALEIVELAAKLGIDARPDTPALEGPEAETVAASENALAAVRDYVNLELANPSDAVGAPPKIVRRFLDGNRATLAALVAAASGRRGIVWDQDVSRGSNTSIPSWAGLTLLQKAIAANVLLELRAAQTDAALQGIEAMWRIARSLAVRPELLSQLMAIVQARLAVGLLRKVHAPAYGWESRLREGEFLQSFLAAFQNDPWPVADHPGMEEDAATVARIYRRFADGLSEKSPCLWNPEDLRHAWAVAISGEPDPDQIVITISSEAVIKMLMRSYRLLFDEELSARVLDARAERAASRDDQWPERLPDLESKICPGRFYVYSRPGEMKLGFDGPAPGHGEAGLNLPAEFRGAAPPTRTPTPRPGMSSPRPVRAVLTPTPAGGMIAPQ